MPTAFRTVLLLTASNVFMTFAWYGHLKTLGNRKWYIAVVASWSIAFFEYLLQVPANRIGHTAMSSTEYVESVLVMKIVPAARAARAVASSPSGWASR